MAALVLGLSVMLALGGTTASGAAGDVTVPLNPVGGSGESGTAILTPDGSKTKVVVNVTGQPAGTAHPAHVHKGTCAQLDPKPAYGLPTVSGGKSQATIDVPLATLQSGKFAINAHKSAQDLGTHVFCGDIPGR
jgi:hypothetical protein